MLAMEYSIREFFNQLTTISWEWLLATTIVIGKMLASRLESRSHTTKTSDEWLLSMKTVTRNAHLATRSAQPETRNP
ncbi:MAG: hypothetical protein V2I56_22710 [Desulfobacteraceae bacterium]|nr:hypothetical protein [Desulfobacteraceae bacterium]